MSSSAALSYHEPGIVTILVLSSFLILQNVINWLFDRLLFCGLIGQIAIGVAWGTPGGKWLTEGIENTIMQLGYLGLILIVFEGGLSTNLKTLKSNLFLSSVVAVIGISAPIGLSFSLQGFMDTTKVQAFAAGAALCSTSLGTTFTILSTSGLSQSRLGVVLSSAAMMDDIVGLVMSGIISNLGKSSDFSPVTVIRPVLVSVAFAVILPLILLFLIQPLTKRGVRFIQSRKESRLHRLLSTEGAALAFHTLVLLALVTGASYAGTSVLFAAYLAGASSTWWDSLCLDCIRESDSAQRKPKNATSSSKGKGRANVSSNSKTKKPQSSSSECDEPQRITQNGATESNNTAGQKQLQSSQVSVENPAFIRGTQIFEKYYHPALQFVLKPFFFASIGFSIPISKVFGGDVIWKGIVYSILMVFAKLLCGLCLLRFEGPSRLLKVVKKYLPSSLSVCWPNSLRQKTAKNSQREATSKSTTAEASSSQAAPNNSREPVQSSQPKTPVSLYPAALLGSAMVARGEIGFLISSVAESEGVLGTTGDGGSSELFLVVTWAILLCTLLGPVTVGLMVKRVKRLQAMERSQRSGKDDPLGSWGVVPSH
ncbi:hypothetical protein M409DRAFT_52462 [Zasmidium cellare ATCC 36951]|uniref:Cation/H+ exchanger transmembrane domain-containing protein n=1 Tax=Zasmidium cellare ATCC 36951 TaxID=1080233 RepID=A0A6A6CTM5_ZASCE|nr:uncharacterized protein M409DRAFT_52462 [Zasmidium cellare ATCC 36951]KAF2169182.1 hypothetical protein M409DRAFT_52462 [Zasmidium cellare ATCC 36951]